MRVDALIVGQGLAGSCLALALRQRGASSLLLADPAQPGASRIATGLCAPVTGQRFAPTWAFDACLPVADALYASTAPSAWRLAPVVRPFDSSAERDRCLARHPRAILESLPSPWLAPHGAAAFPGGACLDVPSFLQTIRAEWSKADRFRNTPFDVSEVQFPAPGFVGWRDVHCRWIVLCCGAHTPHLLSDAGRPIPWQRAKGESLVIDLELDLPPFHLGGSFTLSPTAAGRYRAGSTLDWTDTSPFPTAQARTLLQARLSQRLALPCSVHAHDAAFRLALPDRRPLLGAMPNAPWLIAVTALAAKGVLTAPWLAARLADYLTLGAPLPPELSPARFA